MKSYSAMVVGSLSLDRINLPSETLAKIGGAVTYSGLTYKSFGLDTHIISNFDSSLTLIESKLNTLGLKYSGGRGNSITTFDLTLRGDKRELKLMDASETIEPRDLPDLTGFEGHIHLGPLHSSDIDLRCIEHLANTGINLGIDIQGFVRKIDGERIVTEAHPRIQEVLNLCQFVKADEEELESILVALEIESPENLVDQFDLRELVVTAASKGGAIYLQGRETVHYGPEVPEQSEDSTGAGDVFFASYLTYRLRDKLEVQAASHLSQETVIRHLKGQHLDQSQLAIDLDLLET